MPQAWLAVKRGDIKPHRRNMTGIYVGGLLLAGSLEVLLPDRMLHNWLFK